MQRTQALKIHSYENHRQFSVIQNQQTSINLLSRYLVMVGLHFKLSFICETSNSYCLHEHDMYFCSLGIICLSFYSRQNKNQVQRILAIQYATEASLRRRTHFLNFSKNTALLRSTPEIARSLQQKFSKQRKNRFPQQFNIHFESLSQSKLYLANVFDCCSYKDTIQLICCANQFTGFYMRATCGI